MQVFGKSARSGLETLGGRKRKRKKTKFRLQDVENDPERHTYRRCFLLDYLRVCSRLSEKLMEINTHALMHFNVMVLTPAGDWLFGLSSLVALTEKH